MREIIKNHDLYSHLQFESPSNFNIITLSQRLIILFNLKPNYNTEMNSKEYFKAITNVKQL